MKVLNQLNLQNKTILTLDEDILHKNYNKVIIEGEEYDFDIAYDMKNTIGINAEIRKCENISFKDLVK